MGDLRYALRGVRRQPVFATVLLLTLGMGFGGNVAIFSLLYQTVLRPLPYPDSDRLVFVWNTYPRMGLPRASVSIPDYVDRLEQAPSIESAALMTGRMLNLAADNRPEQVRAPAITPSFFTTLGRQPILGRAFDANDATEGNDRVVILTANLWRTRFGADPSVVKREIRLSGEAYRIVGVLPADFELPSRDTALLVPFTFTAAQRSDAARGNEFSQMIARRPGATTETLRAEMATIVSRNLDRLPARRAFAESSGFGGYAVPYRDQLVGDVRAALLLLQVGALLVLLIACVNVANLLLIRLSSRQHELAVRGTLGAARKHIARQLLVEGLVLSGAGAGLGLFVGLAGARALVWLAPQQLAGGLQPSLDAPTAAFAAALALLTGLAFGTIPALSVLSGNAATYLRDGTAGRGTLGRAAVRTHSLLVVAETALALTLLVGAGLLIRSFAKVSAVNPGFNATSVLTATIALPPAAYPTATERGVFWERVIARVRTLPGITAVGLTSNIPLSGDVSSGSYAIDGYTPGPGEAAPHGRQEVVGGDYFAAMQIPLISGRLFDERDGPDSVPVVVIDEYLARRYFANGDPVGRHVRRGGPDAPPFTIIGVVGTVNSIDLALPVDKERLYYPVAQARRPSMALMLKTAVPPQSLVNQVAAAVRELDPELPLANVRTMDEWLDGSLALRRAPMMLMAAFGGVALMLAAIGTYGVLAFGVAQRTREFGIRQALGADQRSVLFLVLGQGVRQGLVGIGLGVTAALGLGRALQSQLFGVEPSDVPVLVVAALTMLAMTLAACYIPARRAMRLQPTEALRAY